MKRISPLFVVIFWQNFTVFGIMMYLVLHLTSALHFSTEKSIFIFGFFASLVFLTPIVGGWLADRHLSQKAMMLNGQLLMAVGSCLLFLPQFYFLGLASFALGYGYVKPCIPALIGTYSTESTKQKYFTAYYALQNLGAFLGSIVFGLLMYKNLSNFIPILCAIAAIISMVFVYYGVGKQPLKSSKFNAVIFWAVITVVVVVFSYYCFLNPRGLSIVPLILFLLVSIIFLFKYKHSSVFKAGMLASTCCIPFFMFSYQVGELITIFLQHHVDREVLGIHIPTLVFSSLDPLFVVVFAPILAWFWSFKYLKNTSLYIKIGLAFLCAALCFVMLNIVSHLEHHNASILILVVLSYIFIAVAEVMFAPAVFVKLAEVESNLRNQLMGYFFVAVAAGVYLSALLANTISYYHLLPFTVLSILSVVFAVIYFGVTGCLGKKHFN